jgi:hypothetical protein
MSRRNSVRQTRRDDARTVVAEGEAAKALASRLGQEQQRGRESSDSDESSDGTDLVPGRRYQPVSSTQDNLLRVLDKIPENERAKLKFKFNVKKPNPKGGIYKNACGEFIAFGEDWQTKIKTTIGQLKGPGEYEGIPYDHTNKQIDGAEPWTFEIGEDQAREWGWQGQTDEDKKTSEDATRAAAALATSAPAGRQGVLVAVPQAAAPAVDPVEAVKKEAEVTRAQIELEKAKQDLERTKKAILAQQSDVTPKKAEASESETFSKQLLDAERARIKAEEEAKGARAVADKEAELLRQKADNDKKIAELKTEAAEAKSKADAALTELKGSLERREAEFARKFDELKAAMTTDRESRDRERDRETKKPNYAEIAAAVGAALGPLASAFAPLAAALQSKLMEPAAKPEKTESPAAMISAMAEVMEKFKPPAPPKQIDSMDIVRQTMDLVKASQPVPTAAAPHIDAMDIVKQTVELVKASQPATQKVTQVDPMDIVRQTVDLLKVAQPQGNSGQQQTPQAYMDQVLNTAERLQQAFGGRDHDDDREPTDTLDLLVQSKEKLQRIGVPVQIGQQEQEKKTMVRDLAEAAKEIIPSIGRAVAESGYFTRPQHKATAPAAPAKETPDPAAAREQQRRKALHQQAVNREMARRRALAQGMGHPQGAGQQQPQQPQQPRPTPAPVQAPMQRSAPAPRPAPPPAPRPAPVQVPAAAPAPAAQKSQDPSRFMPPAGPAPYGLPTEGVPQYAPRPGFVPTETPPQRQMPAPGFIPTEAAPMQTLTPQQAEYMARKANAERVEAARRAAAQRAAVERVAAQRVEAAASASTPVIEAHTPPVPVQTTPAPVRAGQGPPTAKMWGEICDYLVKAIRKPEDPEVAAVYLAENFPSAVQAILSNSGGNVELVEVGLMMLAGQVGAYGSTVSELASAIRVEPGKAWATQLLAAFKKSKEGK